MIDQFTRFCLPRSLQVWINEHDAPNRESAIMKDVPNTPFNHFMANQLKRYVKIRRKYRGSSSDNYRRPTAYCHKAHADRFAIYVREAS